MNFSSFYDIYPFLLWDKLSNKIKNIILHPNKSGEIPPSETEGLILIQGIQGHRAVGNYLSLQFLIDVNTSTILEAKFLAFGHPVLIAAANSTCEILCQKPAADLKTISVPSLEKYLRDSTNIEAIPKNSLFYIYHVIDAIEDVVSQFPDIPQLSNITLPSFQLLNDSALSTEEWSNLSVEERKNLINAALDTHIVPYITMDGGGISLIDLVDNLVTISYSGNCSNCYSAIGSTFSSIQEILKSYVYKEIEIKVDENSLFFLEEDTSF